MPSLLHHRRQQSSQPPRRQGSWPDLTYLGGGSGRASHWPTPCQSRATELLYVLHHVGKGDGPKRTPLPQLGSSGEPLAPAFPGSLTRLHSRLPSLRGRSRSRYRRRLAEANADLVHHCTFLFRISVNFRPRGLMALDLRTPRTVGLNPWRCGEPYARLPGGA